MSFGKRVAAPKPEFVPQPADIIDQLDKFWDQNQRAPQSRGEFEQWEGGTLPAAPQVRMTREQFREGLQEISKRRAGKEAGAGRFLATVDQVPDELLVEFNDSECVAFRTNEIGRRILTLQGRQLQGIETASDYLQACIDEKINAAEVAMILEQRKRATRALSMEDLQDRLTACANLCHARLTSGRISNPRHEQAIMYDMRTYLRFVEELPTVPYENLERFNAMRARTGVAVFQSDKDDTYRPEQDRFLLLYVIKEFLPEDSSGHLSEIKDAAKLVDLCVKAMRQDFQNEFDQAPPDVETEEDEAE